MQTVNIHQYPRSEGCCFRFPISGIRAGCLIKKGNILSSFRSSRPIRSEGRNSTFPHRNKGFGDHHIIPHLPWGSGLIYGGLDLQARSDVRTPPVYALEEMLNEIGE